MGGGLGLVGSGFVLESLSWQWLFVIGGAPVLVAAALIWAFVPESPVRRGGRPDFLGAAVFSVALVALLLAVTKGEAVGLGLGARRRRCSAPPRSRFAAWMRIERRVPEPLVDLRDARRRAMALTNAATVLVGFSLTAFFVLMPAFVQVPTYGFGASLTEAGLYFIPTAVAMIVCGPAAGWLGTRLGHAVALRIGLAASARSRSLLLAFAHADPALGAGLDGPARRRHRVRAGRHRHARDRELARERDGRRERREHDHADGRRGGRRAGRGGGDLRAHAGAARWCRTRRASRSRSRWRRRRSALALIPALAVGRAAAPAAVGSGPRSAPLERPDELAARDRLLRDRRADLVGLGARVEPRSARSA